MVFKLVRTDTEEPRKIQLPLGTHLIGRGKFLDCDDKRVSRNHGQLEVVDDSVTIRALHQNPCFYIKKGDDQTQILKKNFTASLCNGDKFGLLPDSYWYEVLHCSSLDINNSPERNMAADQLDQTSRDSERTVNNGCETQMYANETIVNRAESPSFRSNSPNLLGKMVGAGSPSLTPRPDSPSMIEGDGSPSVLDNLDNPAEAPVSPSKRSHSPEPSEAKKIKTEPVDGASEDAVTVKQDPDAVPGPSNDQRVDAPNDNNPGMPPSPVKPPNRPGRERCMYGANCYRKNPQHKVQFAHPCDSDWGPGARGVCPWGAHCTRRNPRHWQDHEHPPGVHRPATPPPPQQARPARTPKPRKKQRDSESDEESPTANLIVTGKRQRKPVKRNDEWDDELDSDREQDPYGTDESDEWVPSVDDAESQYTQTQNMLDD